MLLASLLLLASTAHCLSHDLAQNLLRVMNLPSRPPPRHKRAPHVPDYIWSIYRSLSAPNAGAKTVHSYFVRDFRLSPTETNLVSLSFNISRLPIRETIQDAELRVVVPKARVDIPVARLNVFEVINAANQVHRLLDTKLIPLNHTTTQTLNVRPAVARLLSHYAAYVETVNLTLRLQLTLPNGVIIDPSDFYRLSVNNKPMLIVYGVDSTPRRRTKRNHRRRHADSTSKRRMNSRRPHAPRTRRSRERDIRWRLVAQARRQLCRRHSLYIDFSELNWHDWILAPRGYHAYFCAGKCPWPIMDTRNSTNHAIVQALIHSVSHVVPQPCCVPTDLASISLLYLDYNDRIVIKNYPDMIVEGCGCR